MSSFERTNSPQDDGEGTSSPSLSPQSGLRPASGAMKRPAELAKVLEITKKVFQRNGWLKTVLHMENRPQQTRMAEAVAKAFTEGSSLLFEAGTGVGKSLAYLIPGIIYAKLSKKKFVVSTNTIPLQEQILHKDLEVCRQLFSEVPELHPFAGFKVVLMLGKANYLCGTRLAAAIRRHGGIFDGSDGTPTAEELQRLRDWWADGDCTGLREHLPFRISDETWDMVNADSRACSRKNCTPQTCAYRRARAEFEAADLVVVNHSLLFSFIDAGVTPKGETPGVLYANDFVVLDESHQVPDIATNYFGVEANSHGVQRLFAQISKACRKKGVLAPYAKSKELDTLIAQAMEAADDFFNQVRFTFLDDKQAPRPLERGGARGTSPSPMGEGRGEGQNLSDEKLVSNKFGGRAAGLSSLRGIVGLSPRFSPSSRSDEGGDHDVSPARANGAGKYRAEATPRQHLGEAGALATGNHRFREPNWLQNICEIPFGNLENRLKIISDEETDDTAKAEITDFWEKIQDYRLGLRECLELKRAPNYAYWAEVGSGAKHTITVSGAPIDVAKQLAETLFSRGTSAILSSATLADGNGSMTRFCARCGTNLAEEPVNTQREKSPFNYLKNMEIFVAKDCPDSSAVASTGKASAHIIGSSSKLGEGDRRTATVEESDCIAREGRSSRSELRDDNKSNKFPPLAEEGGDGAGGIAAAIAYNADVIEHCSSAMPDGGILVLCTSFDFCFKLADALRQRLGDSREIFVQGEGEPRSRIIKRFKKSGNAILIGNHSFWMGIDVPGPALSQVVVPRLPFANPSLPIVSARTEWMESQGKNAFREMSLPDAVLQFRQGIGRLIRKASDCGRIILTDSRLMKKSYGKTFLSALPHQNYTVFTRENFRQVIGPWKEPPRTTPEE